MGTATGTPVLPVDSSADVQDAKGNNVSQVEMIDPRDLDENMMISTDELIRFYAQTYGVKETSMIATLRCESEFKHDGIYGDNGKAYGIAQFHEATFNEFKDRAEMPGLDYKSMEDQIQLMAWAFANNSAYHWTCWRKYKAKQIALAN